MGDRVSVVVFPCPNEVEIGTMELPDVGPTDVCVRTVCSVVSQGTERWLLTNRYRCVGGRGEFGSNLPEDVRASMIEHPLLAMVDELRAKDLADGPQVFLEGSHDLSINLQRVEGGVALHLIRYDYDEECDELRVLPELALQLRLPRWYRHAFAFTPSGEMGVRLGVSLHNRGMHRLELRDVPLYSIVLLQG